jgi:hypothetical protein
METLSKFGVPLGGGSGRGGILQPKFKYRFRVRLINFGPLAGGLDITQNVVKVDRPKVQYEEVEVHAYNSRAYYAGKHQWQPITLDVRDDVTNAVARLVGHQVQKQMNHFEQTSFLAGVNYKFSTLIEVMDGGNDGVLETWTLEGCWLQDIQYDTLDYGDSTSFLTISMTMRYDNATLSDGLMPSASGSGGKVGGGLGFLNGLKIG